MLKFTVQCVKILCTLPRLKMQFRPLRLTSKARLSVALACLLALSLIPTIVLGEQRTVQAASRVQGQNAIVLSTSTPTSILADDKAEIVLEQNAVTKSQPPVPLQAFQKLSTTISGNEDTQANDVVYPAELTEKSASSMQEFDEEDTRSIKVSQMIAFAQDQLGKNYKGGAEGPDSFDCSGLTYYILTNTGINTGRNSAQGYSQIKSWEKIESIDDLKKGDLVFFYPDDNEIINHVAIYLGNGQIIHASSNQGEVIISELSGYYQRNFVFGRRVIT